MPKPGYYHRQADLCLRMALSAARYEERHRLLDIANGYRARAVRVEAVTHSERVSRRAFSFRTSSSAMFAWGRQLTPNGGEKRGYYDFFPNGVPGSCHDGRPHSGELEDGPITLTSGVSAALAVRFFWN